MTQVSNGAVVVFGFVRFETERAAPEERFNSFEGREDDDAIRRGRRTVKLVDAADGRVVAFAAGCECYISL